MKKVSQLKLLADDDKWDEVDEILVHNHENTEFIEFARDKARYFDMGNDQNQCDLAASILEKAKRGLVTVEDVKLLRTIVMSVENIDTENYALYRVACALVSHGLANLNQMQIASITAVLQVFSCDEEAGVSESAKKYLDLVKNTNDKQLAIKYYEDQGLEVEDVEDPPSKIYKQHKHNKTHLFTLNGGVMLMTDESDKHYLLPGHEYIVNTDQLHYAEVGESGWDYIAAFDPIEEEKYKHVTHD